MTSSLVSRYATKIGFAVALALLAGAAWLEWRHTARMQETAEWVALSNHAEAELNRLLSLVQDIETGARGYVVTGEPAFLEPFEAGVKGVAQQQRRLLQLIRDDEQKASVSALEPLIAQRIAISRRNVELRRSAGFDAARRAVAGGEGKAVMDQIRARFADIQRTQQALLEQRSAQARHDAAMVPRIIIAGTGLSAALLMAVFALMLRENQLRAQAQRETRRALNLVDGTRDGVFICDPQTLRFSYVNQGAVDQVGYTRAEFLEMTPLDINPEFDEPRFREMLAPLLSGAVPSHTFSTVHRRKDGTDVPVEIALQSVADAPGSRSLVAIVRDVTERRKAEAERDRFFILSLDMLGIAGTDGYFKRLNPAFNQTLGYTTDELLARPFLDFVHPDDRAATLAEVEKLSHGVPTIQFENRYQCKDGSWKWLSWKTQPFPSEGLLYATARDITERKEAEFQIIAVNTELQHRAQQLDEANKELEGFTYSVSHDLRSPLRAIDGFARIFEEDYRDKLDDEGRRLLQVIRDNSQKMGQLIDDLLSFSRLGRKPVEATRLEMRNVVEKALAEVRAGANTTRTEIVRGNLRPAWGDEALLQQVWVNLLSNAIKYSGNKDGAKVEIGSLDAGAPEHSGITYFVRDNGVGFDMRYYDKLFGVFQRLHSAAEFPGTGVGLAIVHRLVTRHGGRVWAEAAINEGATFYFSLPGEDKDDRA